MSHESNFQPRDLTMLVALDRRALDRRALDRDATATRRAFWAAKEQQRLEGEAYLAARDAVNVEAWLARYSAARNAACTSTQHNGV